MVYRKALIKFAYLIFKLLDCAYFKGILAKKCEISEEDVIVFIGYNLYFTA